MTERAAWATDFAIAQLREWWPDLSISAAEMGRRLGCSKNSIVGKAQRLGLPRRESPIQRNGPGLSDSREAQRLRADRQPTQTPLERPPAIATKPEFTAPPRPVAPPVVPTRRAVESCCWPFGDPGTRTFRFCDDASLSGKPYCDEHAKLAFVKIRDRSDEPALSLSMGGD